MAEVLVHDRVTERHPELSESDVLSAWENMVAYLPRIGEAPDQYVAIGADSRGRLIEMVANRASNDVWIIFHAMTPPSHKTLVELKLIRR